MIVSDGFIKYVMPIKKPMTNADKYIWPHKQRNGSDDFGGHFNIHTGKDNIHELGVVKNWNYQPETKYYKDDCNKVRGKCYLRDSFEIRTDFHRALK